MPKHQEVDLHRLRNGCGDLSRLADRAKPHRLSCVQTAALVDEGRRPVRGGSTTKRVGLARPDLDAQAAADHTPDTNNIVLVSDCYQYTVR